MGRGAEAVALVTGARHARTRANTGSAKAQAPVRRRGSVVARRQTPFPAERDETLAMASAFRLTRDLVLQIRLEAAAGVPVAALVAAFDVSRDTVYSIITGKTYVEAASAGTALTDYAEGPDHPGGGGG